MDELKSHFRTTFTNYLSTAFDVVFRNELSLKSDNQEQKIPEDQLNLSVTDDDLQVPML